MAAPRLPRRLQKNQLGVWSVPGDHGLYAVLAAAGGPALRQCHRRAARGALPQEHWLGNRPGNWWIRRGARNKISANEPYSICKNRDESAIDNSKLSCNCITFTIWVKINEGNGDSEEEMSVEVITSLFIGICISWLSLDLTRI